MVKFLAIRKITFVVILSKPLLDAIVLNHVNHDIVARGGRLIHYPINRMTEKITPSGGEP